MHDDELLDLDEDKNEEIIRENNRFQKLSEKVKLTAKERDELAKAKEAEAQARAEAEKERDFYKGFNTIATKYQGVSEYQDKIWEKVKSGYDVEDAAVAILNKEGKLNPMANAKLEDKSTAAGGSAAIGIADMEDKTIDKMSQSERLQILKDLEQAGQFKL